MKRYTADGYREDENGDFVRWEDVGRVMEACLALSKHKLRMYQDSGPFRRICRAELDRRLLEERS